jgi:hypothetical protein
VAFGDGEEVPDELRDAIVEALNKILRNAEFHNEKAFRGLKLTPRFAELLKRRSAGKGLAEDDLAELNRLLLEAVYAESLPPTPAQNLRMMTERILRKRHTKEPAVRSTGRLIRDRGALFRDWKPLEPRLALVGGIYSHAELNTALVVAHVPFDLLRNELDRRERLASYRYAMVAKGSVGVADYDDLLGIEKRGGVVFVPEGFKPPEGRPALKKAVRTALGFKKFKGAPHEWRAKLHEWARSLRPVFHKAGFLPYFDSENLDVVMQGFTYRGHSMVFVVNDKRTYSDPERGGSQEDKGLPNDVDILVRDRADGLRVIDIDTGEEPRLVRGDGGWHIRDTVGPAWYKIYAVVKNGTPYKGPAPLRAGPEVVGLTASRRKAGREVLLKWKLPFDDWVGCDVARYRIHRGAARAKPSLLADVEGRIMTGPGGVVTSYVDSTAEAGAEYVYRLQTVTPLRRPGPLSEAVSVR